MELPIQFVTCTLGRGASCDPLRPNPRSKGGLIDFYPCEWFPTERHAYLVATRFSAHVSEQNRAH